jgi:hypothetical protein
MASGGLWLVSPFNAHPTLQVHADLPVVYDPHDPAKYLYGTNIYS